MSVREKLKGCTKRHINVRISAENTRQREFFAIYKSVNGGNGDYKSFLRKDVLEHFFFWQHWRILFM